MLRVGLTGGIGSGKTTVARVFECLGIPVFYSDDEAKNILNTNDEVKKKVRAYFGEVYDSRGRLDRKQLGLRVFSCSEDLEKLNSIIHPCVLAYYNTWASQREQFPFTLKESAILFETDNARKLDYVISVSAPEDLRISRVCRRDGVSPESVLARLSKQWTDEEREKHADFVIVNNATEAILPQILSVYKQLVSI